ncbi:SDR family oxidoreductase [Nakamurella sp. GG22]
MRVVIAGGHGKVGLRLARLLGEREAHPVGLVRKVEQEAELVAVGAHPEVFDLESGSAADLAEILRGADAVVFAAGAGPGSGAARKDTVDRGGAVLLADAAELAGVRRYVMVSAIGADDGPGPDHDEVFAAYITAKKAADDDIRGRDLDWTILRPGGLTTASGTGLVHLAEHTERGQISREDVAAVILALLDEPRTAGLSLDLVGGDTPIDEAVAGLVGAGSSE